VAKEVTRMRNDGICHLTFATPLQPNHVKNGVFCTYQLRCGALWVWDFYTLLSHLKQSDGILTTIGGAFAIRSVSFCP
jgi:hypothetical protein